ncbi:Haze protective factor 1 [Streptomyces racemochromogenes]|uniref:Haze protective factor 1 n=1 Tax=Streptomyces racemochromogenes TaxID=67353 RepID=UPI0035EEC872
MEDDALLRESTIVPIDRSIFGIDEERSPEEPERPYWVDLPMDAEPVRVGRATVRVLSKVESHDATVTIEVSRGPYQDAAPDFDLLGEWPYSTASGAASLYNIDGPLMSFTLKPASAYTVQVWRKGGSTAVAKHAEIVGKVYPIEGLEEYVIRFWAS